MSIKPGEPGYFGKNNRYPDSYPRSKARRYANFNLPNPKWMTDYFGVTFLSLLNRPFEDWDAYDLGLIDENGNQLQKASTVEEKESYNYYIRLIIRFKQLLEKQLPDIRRELIYDRLLLVRENYDKIFDVYDEILNINNNMDITKTLNEITTSGAMASNGGGMGGQGSCGGTRRYDGSGRKSSNTKKNIVGKKKKKKRFINFKEYVTGKQNNEEE